MRRTVVPVFTTFIVSLPIFAADLSGPWRVTGSISDMPIDIVCTFKQETGALAGACTAEEIGELALKGEMDGASVSWSYDVSYQGQQLSISYQGTLESESEIKGSIMVMGNASGSFTAVRNSSVAQAAATAPLPPAKTALWDESKLSKPTYKVIVENNVPVPMRDGVKLAADIYRPDADGKFPALVLRTPYNKSSSFEISDSKWWAERGYVLVNQDVRGRFASGGRYYAYQSEADDGFDTDEWVAKQPWSNGKIGTLGGSYLGYTQLAQGIRGSSHLLSMATDVTSTDVYHGWTYVDGAFHLGFTLPWGAGTIYSKSGQEGTPNFLALPIATADESLGHANTHYRDWLKHPRRNDPYWNTVSYELEAHKIKVPLLVFTGWFDIFLRGALQDDISIRSNGVTKLAREAKRLIIGPWTHFKTVGTRDASGVDFGPEAEVDGHGLYLAWHDHWLKGIDNGVDTQAPITIFVMGENIWRDEREWPLARTKYTKYYLASGGKANSAAGDGVLAPTQVAQTDSDAYVYDPASPVPSLGGNLCCSSVPGGIADHRSVEARDDVLVYTTPVLTEPLEVTGPIAMKLFATTSAKDTDWVARLVDVHPDGRAMNVQDGILRARYRGGKNSPAALLQPGKVYGYDIDLWATSYVFLPGHRIRVEVTSSNFPRFDRNLNTGEDPATGTRMERARQKVFHNAAYPSHIVLPIIPRAASGGK
jgi:putative CocE/NonD family hydrolase